MQLIQAVFLGLIQGLTEFLPVSSSGHLVLLQSLFGIKEPEILFDIFLHVGTLAAVCVVFFAEIRSILNALISLPQLTKVSGGLKALYQENEPARMAVLIVVGSVPTAILGLFFRSIVNDIFGSTRLVGLMLILTGILLWQTRRFRIKGRPLKNTGLKEALIIGLVQGFAIIPGISRSGSTIAVALFMGLDRELAGRYSFLLSLPAILGALILSFNSPAMETALSVHLFVWGTITAAIVGFAALKILLRLVRRGRIHFFAPYCWIVGIVTLIIGLLS